MTELKKITGNTYYLDDNYVRCFLLVGDERALWIDAGVSHPDLVGIAREVTDLPLVLANTHGDGDHVSSADLFGEIYMHEADYRYADLAGKCSGSRWIPVKDGDRIELGGRTLEVIEIPGHTYGSVAFLEREARRLYAGDTIQNGRIFLFGEHRCPDRFEAALKKLLTYRDAFDEVCAAHGTPVLPAGACELVLKDWQAVLAGEIEAGKADHFGRIVEEYVGAFCGFYQ